MIIDNLPNTLAGLLEVAIKDLKDVERDKMYRVNMAHWHLPLSTGHCVVCLAGAVLAKSCGMKISEDYSDVDTSEKFDGKIMALEDLRTGNVTGAYRELYGEEMDFEMFNVTAYAENSDQFYKDLDRVLKYLKVYNL